VNKITTYIEVHEYNIKSLKDRRPLNKFFAADVMNVSIAYINKLVAEGSLKTVKDVSASLRRFISPTSSSSVKNSNNSPRFILNNLHYLFCRDRLHTMYVYAYI
jgi:hypothetical protein